MADRRAIRDAVFDELSSVAGTYTVSYGDGTTDTVTLDSTDVRLQHPETPETYPQLIYDVSFARRYFNDVGTSPDAIERDNSGNVIEEIWREYIEASYLFHVRASNEVEKEPIYEQLRRQFAQYQFGYTSWKNVHSDIIRIEVLDADRADSGDVENRIRGEILEAQVVFFREYTFTTDNIQAVNHEVDADLDSNTTGLQFTTT